MTTDWLERSPEDVAGRLRVAGLRRAWIAWDEASGAPLASTPLLDPVAEWLSRDRDYRRHEALFLATSPSCGALFGTFIHSTSRGQAQGGLRHWSYETFEGFLRDGLRLSLGMARKNALAGLWWGGGKGIIARLPGDGFRDSEPRRTLYREYARFVTGLRGCYVTAQDVGTGPLDMAEVARYTRFATCVPPEIGGSGNPSAMTALGVVEAMEAALDETRMGSLADKRIVMQGAGQVGASILERLFERGIAHAVVSEISEERCHGLRDFFAGRPIVVRCMAPDDPSILAEPCDLLVPNALGGVLSPKTIGQIRARVVCGAANNPLEDELRDAEALRERGIVYVPDYIANRMGIVSCCNEHAGSLPRDPAILAHLDRGNPDSIYRVTRRVLERAAELRASPVHAANELADELIPETHPLYGSRAQQIVKSLLV